MARVAQTFNIQATSWVGNLPTCLSYPAHKGDGIFARWYGMCLSSSRSVPPRDEYLRTERFRGEGRGRVGKTNKHQETWISRHTKNKAKWGFIWASVSRKENGGQEIRDIWFFQVVLPQKGKHGISPHDAKWLLRTSYSAITAIEERTWYSKTVLGFLLLYKIEHPFTHFLPLLLTGS